MKLSLTALLAALTLLHMDLSVADPMHSTEDLEPVELDEVANAPACWIRSKGRGVGRPISQCADDLEKSGLLCYPPCPNGTRGVGPTCWGGGRPIGRGFGKPLGCSDNTENQLGLCYSRCPQGYEGIGPLCWEDCPMVKPYRCGLTCTSSKTACSTQSIMLSMAGFNVLYGIGSMGASITNLVGAAGLHAVVSAFGLVGGSGNMGNGVTGMISSMISYPFCAGPLAKRTVTNGLESAKTNYLTVFTHTCKGLVSQP